MVWRIDTTSQQVGVLDTRLGPLTIYRCFCIFCRAQLEVYSNGCPVDVHWWTVEPSWFGCGPCGARWNLLENDHLNHIWYSEQENDIRIEQRRIYYAGGRKID